MHKGGTGRRWAQIEDETLQKHNLSRLRTENAPLEQTFVRPDGRAYRINLTFLAPRANLARVLASAFWITHQDGCRQATVIAMAHCLRIFNRFLNDRARSQPDLESAQRLSADLLKELAVWLVVKRRFKRKTAAHVFSMCCCFLRKAKRLYVEEFDPSFSTPRNMFPGAPDVHFGGFQHGTARDVGMALFTQYLLPFEVVSVLILIAILGAVVLAQKEME